MCLDAIRTVYWTVRKGSQKLAKNPVTWVRLTGELFRRPLGLPFFSLTYVECWLTVVDSTIDGRSHQESNYCVSSPLRRIGSWQKDRRRESIHYLDPVKRHWSENL